MFGIYNCEFIGFIACMNLNIILDFKAVDIRSSFSYELSNDPPVFVMIGVEIHDLTVNAVLLFELYIFEIRYRVIYPHIAIRIG